ncbi:alpha/beta fold hydrolase [Nocardia arthritidis]|uniref:Alpha/beta fold hydrolase n=1 Tax=Nocardia arthritidis TaxID=228602 RepID=A0A6G9YLZ2_9NOCA|nr:alpha/beta hydrolase [Nocardia arthritidis]QIS14087.1 alpha/beta fold hydrolase [Nocardia arthritidis]
MTATLHSVRSTDGTEIAYQVAGPTDGRALVMLHGLAASMAAWGSVIDRFAQRYRVVTPDLRGHGYSGKPVSGYDNPANWAGDVASVLAAENIASGAVLLGWSYGGFVLTDYLAERGTGVADGVVYVDAVTGTPGHDIQGAQLGPAMLAAAPAIFDEGGVHQIRAYLEAAEAGFYGDVPGPDLQRLVGLNLVTPPRVREALLTRPPRDNDATLRALDVPALVIHGLDDAAVSADTARYIAGKAISDARLSLWEHTTHAPFLEAPTRFVDEVTHFIESLPAKGPAATVTSVTMTTNVRSASPPGGRTAQR